MIASIKLASPERKPSMVIFDLLVKILRVAISISENFMNKASAGSLDILPKTKKSCDWLLIPNESIFMELVSTTIILSEIFQRVSLK